MKKLNKILITLIAVLINVSLIRAQDPSAFITVWQPEGTSINFPGNGTNYTIVVRNVETGEVLKTINNASSNATAAAADNPQPYVVDGLTPGVKYAFEVMPNTTELTDFDGFRAPIAGGDELFLLEIKQWGSIVWGGRGLNSGFLGCKNMDMTATDTPDLTTSRSNIYLYAMFEKCESLVANSSITRWDTSRVRQIRQIFRYTNLFNQPLDWDLSFCNDMVNAFNSAKAFDQNLGNWSLNASVDMRYMFSGSGMSCENYGKTLIGWANNPDTPNDRELGALNVGYAPSAEVEAARTKLVDKGWIIDDAGPCELTSTINVKDNKNNIELIEHPVKDNIRLLFHDVGSASLLSIMDLNGKILLKESLTAGTYERSFPTSNLLPGVYFVHFMDSLGKVIPIKFIKQ